MSLTEQIDTSTRIARQQWRAWIETTSTVLMSAPENSIARQQWRAWIETVKDMKPMSLALRHRPPAMAGVD